jgi:hypothetical protein
MPAAFAHADAATLTGAALAWLLGLIVLGLYLKAFVNFLRRGD